MIEFNKMKTEMKLGICKICLVCFGLQYPSDFVGRFSSCFQIGRWLRTALVDVSRRNCSVRAGIENHYRIFSSNNERVRRNNRFNFAHLGDLDLANG